MQLALTLEEKQYLYKNLRKTMSHEEADNRIKKLVASTHDMVLDLNKKDKSREHIQQKFEEAYQELLYPQ